MFVRRRGRGDKSHFHSYGKELDGKNSVSCVFPLSVSLAIKEENRSVQLYSSLVSAA